MNLKVTNFTASQSSWVRAGTWDGVNAISFPNISDLTFAAGNNIVPSSAQRASVAIGLVWPNFRPSHRSWRLIAQLAVDDINANGTVLPNGLALRTVFSDNLDTASATILAGQDAISRGVVGIVGPARSSQSIALQYYIGGLNVPAVSYGSTADSLSDKVNYPTFFRTVVRDSLQSKAMASLMLSRNWTSFCLLNFNDDYGSSVAAAIVAEAQTLGIEVSGRAIYSSSTVDFEPIVSPLVSANCKIVIAVLDTANFGPLMRLAKAKGIFGTGNNQYVWIFAEIFASVMNRAGIEAVNLTVSDFHGTIITQPALGDPNSALYKRFLNETTRLAVPTLAYGTFVYDAVWALTLASAAAIRGGRDPSVDRLSMVGNLRNLSFTGISGLVQFDRLQDRVGGMFVTVFSLSAIVQTLICMFFISYGVYNFRYWSALPEYVGSWTNTTGVVFTDSIIYGDNTTNVPVDRIVTVLPVVGITYSSPGGGVIIAIAVIVLLCLLCTSIFLFYKSTDEDDTMAQDILRKSSPFFMGIILFGLALCVISIFFWFSPANALVGAARCHLRVWFGFLGAAIAYSALLAKNWRVFYLFNEPSLRVIAITNQTLIGVTAAVVSPLVIVLILWSALSGGFQEVAQPNAANTLAYYTCVSQNDKIFAGISFAYMGILLVFGSILSWKTRSLPDVFKESQYIALSTYNILFITAAGVLIGYIISFEPTAYTFIIVGCILVGALATWALIFINKFYIMKYGPPSSRTSPLTGTGMILSSNPSTAGKRSMSGGSTHDSAKKPASRQDSSSDDSTSFSSSEEKPKSKPTKKPSSSAKKTSGSSSKKAAPKKAPTPSETSEEESEADSTEDEPSSESEKKPAPKKKPASSSSKPAAPSKPASKSQKSKPAPKKESSSSSSDSSSDDESE
jgi:ABC-type branched-subunit amino acid transport system substrate-binding protein